MDDRAREIDGPAAGPEELVRGYYGAIDDGAYGALRNLLAPDFRQVRGDRTLDGRDTFVRFMRDERPETDTTHVVDGVFVRTDDGADRGGDRTADSTNSAAAPADVLVQGRLLRGDGTLWFRYVDAFVVENGRLTGLRTYTH